MPDLRNILLGERCGLKMQVCVIELGRISEFSPSKLYLLQCYGVHYPPRICGMATVRKLEVRCSIGAHSRMDDNGAFSGHIGQGDN